MPRNTLRRIKRMLFSRSFGLSNGREQFPYFHTCYLSVASFWRRRTASRRLVASAGSCLVCSSWPGSSSICAFSRASSLLARSEPRIHQSMTWYTVYYIRLHVNNKLFILSQLLIINKYMIFILLLITMTQLLLYKPLLILLWWYFLR